MARPIVAICIALAAAMLALPAHAQWKWRDKAGQTQYSDLPPPPGIPEQDILGRPRAAQRGAAAASPRPPAAAASGPALSASNVLAPKVAEAELESKLKKAEQEQATKLKAEQARVAAAKADNCQRAQGQMRSLDSGMRLARVNEKGEREILDDAQRAAEVKRTQNVIASDCK